MKMFLIAAIALVVLGGCGQIQKVAASVGGYTKLCVDGVAYIQFPTGMSVKYNRDGSVAPC